MDNTGRDGEETMFNIIRSPSPDENESKDDGSQYLNMDSDEGVSIFDEDERRDEGHNNDDEGNVLQITKTGEPSGSSKSSTSRAVRGPAKRLQAGIKYNIDAIKENGEPLAPKKNADKFSRQCGVIVRDQIPISVQEWNKPAKGDQGVTFVDARAKDLLWESVMAHFTLPDHLTDEEREKVKKSALKKMAIAFKNHKTRIWANYLADGKKTPAFKGTLEKAKDHWDAFVQFKESEQAKERSRVNKINAAKKTWHHTLGPGGYQVGRPKWDLAEEQMIAAGVTPVTLSWPPRCRTWFYAHGGKLEPETGLVMERATLKEASDALLAAIEDARTGKYKPDRENDELTRALKNPEHPGRTRGKGVVPWFEGFADWNTTYRSRARKKQQEEEHRKQHEADRLQLVESKHAELERAFLRQQEQIDSLSQERASLRLQQADPAVPSMPKSSVGSTPADDALLDRYPVDDIKDSTACELHMKVKNISMKVADGYALTNPPEANFHSNPIPAGYARVGVDEVMSGYYELELDIPGGDDERTLREAIHRIILWRKDCIVFPRPPTPPPSPPPRQPTPTLPETQRGASPPPRQQTPTLPETQRGASPPPRQPTPTLPETQRGASPPPRQPSPPPHPETEPISASPPYRSRARQPPPKRKRARSKKASPPAKKKLPYEMTIEENKAEVAAQVKAFFAPKQPPPKEKIADEVIQHFIDNAQPAVKRMDSDYERSIKKSYVAQKVKESSSSQERSSKRGKTVPQLGEQAVQSIPPLIVQSHGVSTADQPVITDAIREMAREAGVTVEQMLGIEEVPKIQDHEVAWKYVPGKDLVRDVKNLSTRMRSLHDWYLREVKNGRESLMVKVKKEHYYNATDVWIDLPELFQLFNQDALDKSLVSCYCLMKIYEMKRDGRYGIGFIDPNTINEEVWSRKPKETEMYLLKFLKQLNTQPEIVFPYNFGFHWILLIIEVDEGKVKVLDSLLKEPKEYLIVKGMVDRVWQRFITQVPGAWKQELKWVRPKCMIQASGNNLCAYYVFENIRIMTSENSRSQRQLWLEEMREKLLPTDRIRALQEEIAGFLLDQVIHPQGEYHYT